MLRWLINLCFAVLLVFCIAFAILWARSYGVSDRLSWTGARQTWWGWSARGYIVLGFSNDYSSDNASEVRGLHTNQDAPIPPFNGLIFLDVETTEKITSWKASEFEFYQIHDVISGNRTAQIIAPFWSICVSLIVLPLAWAVRLIRAKRRNRLRMGFCPSCGYDLRATPTRCPECGLLL